MARIYEASKEFGFSEHELTIFLVRLLFCLFADDAVIFRKSFLYKLEFDCLFGELEIDLAAEGFDFGTIGGLRGSAAVHCGGDELLSSRNGP